MIKKKKKLKYLNWHFSRAKACKKALAFFIYEGWGKKRWHIIE